VCRIVVNVLVRCREQPTSGESIVGAGLGAKFNTRKKKLVTKCYIGIQNWIDSLKMPSQLIMVT
jgi:hypothetical protein